MLRHIFYVFLCYNLRAKQKYLNIRRAPLIGAGTVFNSFWNQSHIPFFSMFNRPRCWKLTNYTFNFKIVEKYGNIFHLNWSCQANQAKLHHRLSLKVQLSLQLSLILSCFIFILYLPAGTFQWPQRWYWQIINIYFSAFHQASN